MEIRRRPNLDDPVERESYRRDLRRLTRVPRLLGFIFIIIGTAMVIHAQSAGIAGALKPIGFGVMAVGWLNLLLILYVQNRFHRARMAGDSDGP